MNAREKFLGVLRFDKTIPPPLYEFGYWAQTIRRWYGEGLPKFKPVSDQLKDGDSVKGGMGLLGVECEDVKRVVGIDKGIERFPLEIWVWPKFEYQELGKDDKGNVLIIDQNGIKKRVKPENTSIAEFLAAPIGNRNDWEIFSSERLNPKTINRYPEKIDEIISTYLDRSFPLTIGGPPVGFFGSLRELMGEVNLFYAYYDQPDLIRHITDYLLNFWMALLDPILKRIKFDCFHLWEDMCYKNGPFISPELFIEYMLPAYQQFTSFLRGYGIQNIFLDTDGYCTPLIPLFLEAGITGLYPMEVAAGMDILEVRKNFPTLQIGGGIDKRVLFQGKEAIDSELERVRFMLDHGGYIPFVDHNVPPDVALVNFVYYRSSLNKLIEDYFQIS